MQSRFCHLVDIEGIPLGRCVMATAPMQQGGSSGAPEPVEVQNLRELLSFGWMTEEDFERQKKAIMDDKRETKQRAVVGAVDFQELALSTGGDDDVESTVDAGPRAMFISNMAVDPSYQRYVCRTRTHARTSCPLPFLPSSLHPSLPPSLFLCAADIPRISDDFGPCFLFLARFRRGIGRMLLAAAEERAHQSGISAVILKVMPDNRAAVSLYGNSSAPRSIRAKPHSKNRRESIHRRFKT